MLEYVLPGSSAYRHTEFTVNLFCNLTSGQPTMIPLVIFMMVELTFSQKDFFLKLFLKYFYEIWDETSPGPPVFQDSCVCRISVNM